MKYTESLKLVFNNIQTILIVILIVIILLMRACSGGGKNTADCSKCKIKTKVKIKYDTIRQTSIEYVPKWKNRIHQKIDTFTRIDTAYILQGFYTKYYYPDTILVDTFGYISLNDTIFENKIYSRTVKQNLLIPTTTITNEILVNKREVYIGVGIAGEAQPINLNYVGAELLYRTKNKKAYSIGIGINQQLSPVVSGKIYWKIGKK